MVAPYLLVVMVRMLVLVLLRMLVRLFVTVWMLVRMMMSVVRRVLMPMICVRSERIFGTLWIESLTDPGAQHIGPRQLLGAKAVTHPLHAHGRALELGEGGD